jgi:hypothetical protein
MSDKCDIPSSIKEKVVGLRGAKYDDCVEGRSAGFIIGPPKGGLTPRASDHPLMLGEGKWRLAELPAPAGVIGSACSA